MFEELRILIAQIRGNYYAAMQENEELRKHYLAIKEERDKIKNEYDKMKNEYDKLQESINKSSQKTSESNN